MDMSEEGEHYWLKTSKQYFLVQILDQKILFGCLRSAHVGGGRTLLMENIQTIFFGPDTALQNIVWVFLSYEIMRTVTVLPSARFALPAFTHFTGMRLCLA